MNELYSVVSPEGIRAASDRNASPSLPDLNGKVIGELWNHGFRGDETFPIIEKLIKEKYPEVRFVSYKEFGNFHDPSEEDKIMASLPEKMKRYGCDAVLVGNGC